MTRVLLILPPASFSDPFHLGLGSIAARLHQAGLECRVWHPDDLSRVSEYIKQYTPDVAGVTATDITYPVAEMTAREVRQATDGRTPIILGGRFASTLDMHEAESAISSDLFDFVIRGEGEDTIVELLDALNGVGSLEKVRGVSYRNSKGSIIHHPPRPLQDELDSWPSPYRQMDFHPINLDKAGPVLSVRDCVHGCQPCTHCPMNRERLRSIPNVIDELKWIQTAGFRSFHFADRDFLSREERAWNLAREMSEAGIKLDWGCIAAPRGLDRSTLAYLASARCRLILYFTDPSTIRDKSTLDALTHTRQAGIGITLGMFELRDLSKDLLAPAELAQLNLRGLVLGFHPAHTSFETAIEITRRYAAELPGVNVQLQDGYPLRTARGDALIIPDRPSLIACRYEAITDPERDA